MELIRMTRPCLYLECECLVLGACPNGVAEMLLCKTKSPQDPRGVRPLFTISLNERAQVSAKLSHVDVPAPEPMEPVRIARTASSENRGQGGIKGKS